jgi:Peptidase propeptide and YPEB domain
MRRLTGLSQRIQGLSRKLAFTEFSISLWHDGPAVQISSVIRGVYDDAISAGSVSNSRIDVHLGHWFFRLHGPRPCRTIEQARSIAVRARPCAITSEELKKEKGGSGSRYSFGIKNGKVFYEVVVDAETGKVLENLKEGRNPD